MKNSPLNDVLLTLKDFRTKSSIVGFTELVENYDQKHGTDTFSQVASLEKEVANLSSWKKAFSDLTYLKEKSKKLEVICQHYKELVELLQEFDDLSDIEKKIQTLAQQILNSRNEMTRIGSQTSLNELRLKLRKILDKAGQFGYTEKDFGLYREERERDWSVENLITTV